MNKTKIVWFKTVERPGSVLKASLFIAGLDKLFINYGLGRVRLMFVGQKGVLSWYFDKDQYEKFGHVVKEKFNSLTKLKKFAERVRRISDTIVRVSSRLKRSDLSDLSSSQLASLAEKFHRAFLESPLIFWGFLFLESRPAELLRTWLRGKVGDSTQIERIIKLLSVPLRPLEAQIEEAELLKIRTKWPDKEKVRKLLSAHVKKFAYLPVYDFNLDPWVYKDFLARLKQLPANAAEVLKLKKTEQKRQKAEIQEVLQRFRDTKIRKLATLLEEFIWLRTYRTDALRKAFYNFLPILEEVARRFGFRDRKIAAMMSIDELIGSLKGTLTIGEEELLRRQKAFILLKKSLGYKIISGSKKVARILKAELTSVKRRKKIRGLSAFPGRVVGKVVKVRTVAEVAKMREGSILVSPMTTPEMVLAMQKASAIVTDEGGITSHAAIVARELGKPCVVGTKVATQVLKDGDIVEVDADKGEVRILGRNSTIDENAVRKKSKRA